MIEQKKLLVIAKTYQQYKNWCRDNHVEPYDRRRVVYISRPELLRGYSGDGIMIVKVGRWWEGLNEAGHKAFKNNIRILEVSGAQVVTYLS